MKTKQLDVRRLFSLVAAAFVLVASSPWNVDAQATIATVAGGGPVDGLALDTPVGSPFNVAVDGAGNVFIAAQALNRVIKVDTSGQATMFAGTSGFGFSGDGGPAANANLATPYGVALDAAGNVYIADQSNHRVRKVDAATGVITTVAGNGSEGFSGDGGPATSASLANPRGVAVDTVRNVLYIADFSNLRVRRVDLATGTITTAAGDGGLDFSGDGGPATSASLSAQGVAVDSVGNLFIADQRNNRIRKVTVATGVITTVAGNGSASFSGDDGSATSAGMDPSGVAIDSAGNLFIADVGNQRIRKVTAATGLITTVAGNGSEGFSGDGGLATSASLADPSGVAVDSVGNLFVADHSNDRVRKVDASNVITTVAGNGSVGFSGDGTLAILASLANPSGSAVDSSGNLFIADQSNHRVRKVDVATSVITTVAGNGSSAFSGDNGPATNAGMDPSGVAIDSAGNLFIADASNHRVRRVDAATGEITTVAGTGTAGFNGDNRDATTATLNSPRNVAIDSAGNLFIADQSNQRIRRVDAATGLITTVAGTGTAGFNGDDQDATTATLNNPRSVAVDSAGNLFIADTSNQRIRRVDAATGMITTVAGNGSVGFSGDGGPATTASLANPFGIAVDGAGNLFIADLSNQRIRRVAATTGVITTVAGSNGLPGFSGDDGHADSARLANPFGVVVDAAGNLFIADSTNHRIRLVTWPDLVARVTAPPATASVGTRFPLTDTVTNRGDGRADPTTTRYYLSVDRRRNAGDKRLTGSRAVEALDPGDNSRGRVIVRIPTNTVPGTYFVLACADNVVPQIEESNERNNCAASLTAIQVTGRPDLVARQVSAPPPTAAPGQRFPVTDTVRNQGTVASSESGTRYYLSVDRRRNPGDTRLTGSRVIPALNPGAASRGTVTVRIPPSTAAGTYFLLACADDRAPRDAETDEGNNCSPSPTAMKVGPDLVEILVANPPASATPGDSFVVIDTVRNRGGATAPETTTRYYLSVDQRRNAGDTRLLGRRVVPELDPGEASRGRVTVTIPTTTPLGTYLLLACADRVAPLLPESDERNNCRASAGTIVVGP